MTVSKDPVASPSRPPAAPWVYGLLGLVPFFACALASLFAPKDLRPEALGAERLYGALILSFLGGARWGLEIRRAPPRTAVISASMVPTLAAFAVTLAPLTGMAFLGLAVAFAAQFLWDARSEDAPSWYPRLRATLTVGAGASLLVCAYSAGVGF